MTQSRVSRLASEHFFLFLSKRYYDPFHLKSVVKIFPLINSNQYRAFYKEGMIRNKRIQKFA